MASTWPDCQSAARVKRSPCPGSLLFGWTRRPPGRAAARSRRKAAYNRSSTPSRPSTSSPCKPRHSARADRQKSTRPHNPTPDTEIGYRPAWARTYLKGKRQAVRPVEQIRARRHHDGAPGRGCDGRCGFLRRHLTRPTPGDGSPRRRSRNPAQRFFGSRLGDLNLDLSRGCRNR
jgi:hypothetical protein